MISHRDTQFLGIPCLHQRSSRLHLLHLMMICNASDTGTKLFAARLNSFFLNASARSLVTVSNLSKVPAMTQ